MEKLGFHLPSLIVYLANFGILAVVLYFIGYKPLLRVMEQRSTRIRESLEEAERMGHESDKHRDEIQKELDKARQEGQALLAQAREMADKYRGEERNKARQEADAFIARARDDIQRERDEAIDQVRRHFAELAILAAERVIERSLDEGAHRDIIEKVLEESSGIKGV